MRKQPHPQPLSLEERGAKWENFGFGSPSPFWERESEGEGLPLAELSLLLCIKIRRLYIRKKAYFNKIMMFLKHFLAN